MTFAQRAFVHNMQVLSTRVSLSTLVACLLGRAGAEKGRNCTRKGWKKKRRKVKDIAHVAVATSYLSFPRDAIAYLHNTILGKTFIAAACGIVSPSINPQNLCRNRRGFREITEYFAAVADRSHEGRKHAGKLSWHRGQNGLDGWCWSRDPGIPKSWDWANHPMYSA